jgi:hypothetical protein
MCHSTSLREPFSKRFFAKIYLVGNGSGMGRVGVGKNGNERHRKKQKNQ